MKDAVKLRRTAPSTIRSEDAKTVEGTDEFEEFCNSLPPRRSSSLRDLDYDAPSCGSFGHPHLCKKPCYLFKFGKCNDGSACNFCHRPHTERRMRLEKQQREQIDYLSPNRILRFANEVISKKFPDANLEIFQPLLDAFPDDHKRLHIHKAVYKAYLQQPLGVLLSLVQRLLKRAEPACSDEIDRMLDGVQASLRKQMADPKTGLLWAIEKDGLSHSRGFR